MRFHTNGVSTVDDVDMDGCLCLPAQLYLFGKKRDQFAGADVQRLSNMVQSLVSESQMKNVEVSFEALKEFYQANAPDKLAEMDDKKIQDILDKAGKGGGPGHYALVKALKKKYNKAPKTRARTVAADGKASEGGAQQDTKSKTGSANAGAGSKPKVENNKPNLHLATLEQLEAELAKRREDEEERRAEAATDDDEGPKFPIYEPKNRTLIRGAEQIVIIGK
jgi:hypothetical protein